MKHGSPEMKDKILDKIKNSIQLSSNDTLLDIGSGDGYYSSRFAEICNKVIAIDNYSGAFKSKFYGNQKIETVCTDICNWIENADLSKVTRVFFSNSFHDFLCQGVILKKLSAGLPGTAYLYLIEFKLDTMFGPPKNIRFTPEKLKAKIEPFGFMQEAFVDLDTHYFVSFKKT